MLRRDVVKAAIRHEDVGETPYFVVFTGDAEPAVKAVYGGDQVDIAIGNYATRSVSAPWWGWDITDPAYQQPDCPGYMPATRGYGSYEGFAEHLKWMRENSDLYILVCIYGIHFEKAYFARGFENFLADMAGEPEFAQELCDTIIRKNLVMLENMLSFADVDGVLLGSDWGSQRAPLMSLASWQRMIMPGEQAMYDQVRQSGKDLWVHSCGHIVPLIPDLVRMGLQVLNPIQPEAMDIAMLKRDFGDKLAFWGGISTQQTLPYGTPEEVRRETLQVAKMMGQHGGYITSPAQDVQGDVPIYNIKALVEACREASGRRG